MFSNATCDRRLVTCHMGVATIIGSLQLQVSFAEYSLLYKALLQKRPISVTCYMLDWPNSFLQGRCALHVKPPPRTRRGLSLWTDRPMMNIYFAPYGPAEGVHEADEWSHLMTHKPIWINKSSVNPKSTSNQSSKPCTVLQYPSREADEWSHRSRWVKPSYASTAPCNFVLLPE